MLVALAPAEAQPADPQSDPPATAGAPADPPAPKPPSPSDVAARQQYLDGDRRYAEGRYEEAVRHFETAYRLSRRAALLYNLANAYERMGDYANAQDRLQRYLHEAKPEGAAAMRQRVQQLAKRAAKKQALDAELTQLRDRPPCPSCELPPAPKPTPRLAYGLIGTGALAFATATVFAIVARDAHSDAAGSCIDDGGLYCSSAANSALERESRFALLTDVSVVVGIAAATTGAYLLWRHRSSERKRTSTVATPLVLPRGLGVGIARWF